ncbi:MAG: hypothetical protein NWF09_06000 [Candidatus Bathyarchaeota archaeon]|nr:hypothetical protein [Candidatus Bathyarchaeota archaeon]
MNKICIFVVSAVVVALIIGIINAFCILSSRQVIREDFEHLPSDDDFGEWTANSHVPFDPNSPGNTVEWHIRRVSNVSHSGMYSVELFIDGKQDDGTIWLERKINVAANAQPRVSVSFWLYSEQESFNTIAAVVAYAGTAKPVVEEDFAVLGAANEAAGWKKYVHTVTLNTDSSGEVWVAVGISVRWETYMTYYIDDVKIEVA